MVHLHHFSKIKSQKESQNSRNQGFSDYFCMMIKGSGAGSGSIPLTNGSGSGRPKNMWIRIRNTVWNCCYCPGQENKITYYRWLQHDLFLCDYLATDKFALNWLLCPGLDREKSTNPTSTRGSEYNRTPTHCGQRAWPSTLPPPPLFAPPPLTCCYFWCPWAGVPVGQVSACRSEDGEKRASCVVSEKQWHKEVCYW